MFQSLLKYFFPSLSIKYSSWWCIPNILKSFLHIPLVINIVSLFYSLFYFFKLKEVILQCIHIHRTFDCVYVNIFVALKTRVFVSIWNFIVTFVLFTDNYNLNPSRLVLIFHFHFHSFILFLFLLFWFFWLLPKFIMLQNMHVYVCMYVCMYISLIIYAKKCL